MKRTVSYPLRSLKNIENEVLSIGFPVSVFEKLKDEFVFEFFEWYAVYNTNTFFDLSLLTITTNYYICKKNKWKI